MNKKIEKANLLYKKGKFKQAREVIAKVNKAEKYRNVDAVVLEAVCVMKLGVFARSKELFLMALGMAEKGQDKSLIHFNLYVMHSVRQEYDEAIVHMLKALETVPSELRNEYRFKLAELYFHDRDFYKAIEICKKLLVYKEFTIRALFLVVNCSIETSDFNQLDYYFLQLEGRLAEMDKTQLGVLANLIGFHRSKDISATLAKIKQHGANADFVDAIHAKHCVNSGDTKLGKTLIDGVTYSNLDTSIGRRVYHETLAQLSLRDENYDKAFNQFDNMNAVVRQELKQTNWQQRDHYEQFRKFSKVNYISDSIAPEERKDIAFMVGFPRSGTTLLENILDAQPNIVTLPEKPALVDAAKQVSLDGRNYPDCFIDIPEDYRNELRALYYKRAVQYIDSDKDISECLLVDKNPLEIIRIPIILSLFPEAKIILSIRHPMDCILSCFMQDFKVSPQLAYFTEIESAFNRYHQLFSLYNQFKEMYNFEDFTVRYEDLVDDLDGTMNKLFSYLQLDATNIDFSQFDKHAKKRVVSTPSASQVRQGIYKQATYRWEKFSSQLTPYRHIVEPYIKQYGY